MDPRILFLDIETAPDVVWTWGVYQANAIAVKEHWYALSFAAKWRGEKDVYVRGLCSYHDYQSGNDNEKFLLEDVWSLLDQADMVVAHNGANFDVRKLNARFIDHGMKPPSPYKVIDTKRDLARVAWFSSNRLDWLSKQFALGKKISTDFSLWEGCMNGDPGSWDKMLSYNEHDVRLLEKLYNKVSSWIEQPNANIYSGDSRVCVNPGCGSTNIQKRGLARAKTRVYQRYRCNKCGTWSRDTHSLYGINTTRV